MMAMMARGVKLLDPAADTHQLDWLFISRDACPDEQTERQLMAIHFRVPHQPWGVRRAFVAQVEIRRSRRRILFRQESGIGL
jgi:hypothetical protein